MVDPVEHRYGGPWTEIKLDAVEYYLQCYTRALKRVPFDLTYIDAFAGTGSREAERTSGGLFGSIEIVTESFAGSARRAIAIEPRFDHLIFIEKRKAACASLTALQAEFPDRDIRVLQGDANKTLCGLIEQATWRQRAKSQSRGVVFLDPYALQVDWKTLQALASTKVLDVWYLFPIRDTLRQLARNFSGIGMKEPMLDRLLGSEWRQLYSIAPNHAPPDLFAEATISDAELMRVVSIGQFEQWLKGRLENEFEFVSQPLPILRTPKSQLFSLFLALSNPSGAAIDLAKKFVAHVNKNFGPVASRRRSGHSGGGQQLSCSSHPIA